LLGIAQTATLCPDVQVELNTIEILLLLLVITVGGPEINI